MTSVRPSTGQAGAVCPTSRWRRSHATQTSRRDRGSRPRQRGSIGTPRGVRPARPTTPSPLSAGPQGIGGSASAASGRRQPDRDHTTAACAVAAVVGPAASLATVPPDPSHLLA
jgi:hypothetical protein